MAAAPGCRSRPDRGGRRSCSSTLSSASSSKASARRRRSRRRSKLVVGGLYRYVRNPMYLAVAATIVGQALVLGQLVLLVYAAVFGVAVYAFVRLVRGAHPPPAIRRAVRGVPAGGTRLVAAAASVASAVLARDLPPGTLGAVRFICGKRGIRRASEAVACIVAVGLAALDRRRRADGGRRSLDQHGSPRSPDPGLPGIRGAVSLPRAQPSALTPLAGGLRHLPADSASTHRLLLRSRARARHAGGAQPLRRCLSRRRPQRAADAEAAQASRRDRANPLAARSPRAGDAASLRDLA